MKYFFTYDEYLPDNVGIELYGGGHICWLILSLFFCIALCRCYSSLTSDRKRRLMRIATASLMLVGEAVRTAALVCSGLYSISFLPLHLCSLALFFSFYHAVFGGKILGDFLYSLCLPGAACALLFPDWTAYPLMNLLSINAFLNHILLVAYPLMLVAGKDLKPDFRNLPKCAGIIICIALPIYFFNKLLDTNYLFLNWPSPGSPLEIFANLLGDPAYLLGYIPMLLTVWSCLYIPTLPASAAFPSLHQDKKSR